MVVRSIRTPEIFNAGELPTRYISRNPFPKFVAFRLLAFGVSSFPSKPDTRALCQPRSDVVESPALTDFSHEARFIRSRFMISTELPLWPSLKEDDTRRSGLAEPSDSEE